LAMPKIKILKKSHS